MPGKHECVRGMFPLPVPAFGASYHTKADVLKNEIADLTRKLETRDKELRDQVDHTFITTLKKALVDSNVEHDVLRPRRGARMSSRLSLSDRAYFPATVARALATPPTQYRLQHIRPRPVLHPILSCTSAPPSRPVLSCPFMYSMAGKKAGNARQRSHGFSTGIAT